MKTTYNIEKDSAKLDEKEAKRLIELADKELKESKDMVEKSKKTKDEIMS